MKINLNILFSHAHLSDSSKLFAREPSCWAEAPSIIAPAIKFYCLFYWNKLCKPVDFLRANYVSIDCLLFYCISFRLLKIQNLAPANWFNVEKWSICFYFDRGKNLNHGIKGLNLALLTSSWCSRWTSFGLNNLPFFVCRWKVKRSKMLEKWSTFPRFLTISLQPILSELNWVW